MKIKALMPALFAILLCACVAEQKKPLGPPAPPPQAKPDRGVELSGRISGLLDAMSAPGLDESSRKQLESKASDLLEEYFALGDEERKEPRLQGSLERLLSVSHAAALKENRAPESRAEEEPSPKDELLNATTFLSAGELRETLKEVEKAKEKIRLGIQIPLDNQAVLTYVNVYQTKLRKWFTGALERSYPYTGGLKKVFKDEGVPPELIYLGIVESAFKPNARSRAGALGMWQFMEGTAKKYGLTVDFWEDERLDPWLSSRASAKYLNFLYSTFGDWNIALASYNCGEGKLIRYVSAHPNADFWTIRKGRILRRETREYVPAILASILMASAPGSFGLEISPSPPADPPAAVTVEQPVDLRSLARHLDVPVEVLISLNPSLKRILTPPRPYELKVPPQALEKTESFIKDQGGSKIDFVVHTVKKGESVKTIAKKYGTDPAELQAVNIGLGARIRRGNQLLVIVSPPENPQEEKTAAEKPAAEAEKTETSAAPGFYVIEEGDTLGKIADDYGVTVEEICKANRITPRTVLRIGMKIVIPK